MVYKKYPNYTANTKHELKIDLTLPYMHWPNQGNSINVGLYLNTFREVGYSRLLKSHFFHKGCTCNCYIASRLFLLLHAKCCDDAALYSQAEYQGVASNFSNLTSRGILFIKIRRSHDRLIFITGFPIHTGIGIPIIKIRRSHDRLIIISRFPILQRLLYWNEWLCAEYK